MVINKINLFISYLLVINKRYSWLYLLLTGENQEQAVIMESVAMSSTNFGKLSIVELIVLSFHYREHTYKKSCVRTTSLY